MSFLSVEHLVGSLRRTLLIWASLNWFRHIQSEVLAHRNFLRDQGLAAYEQDSAQLAGRFQYSLHMEGYITWGNKS